MKESQEIELTEEVIKSLGFQILSSSVVTTFGIKGFIIHVRGKTKTCMIEGKPLGEAKTLKQLSALYLKHQIEFDLPALAW